MAFIPVPNAVRVSMEFTIAGQIVVFTLSLERGTQPTVAEMENLGTVMATWWNNSQKPFHTPLIALQKVTVTDLTTSSSPSVEVPVSPVIPGTASGTALPNNAAAVVSFRTPSRGRSYRGRVYLPGLSDAHRVNPVTFSNGFMNGVIASFLTLKDTLNSYGWEHVVISRRQNKVDLTTGVTTPVTAYLMDSLYDSQRRRLAGRGL